MLHQCKKSRTSSLHLATRDPRAGDTERSTSEEPHALWPRCGRRKGGGVRTHSVKSGIVIVSREKHRDRYPRACPSAKGMRADSFVTALFSVFSNPDSLLHKKSAWRGVQGPPTWTLHFPTQIPKRTPRQRVCCPPRALAPPETPLHRQPGFAARLPITLFFLRRTFFQPFQIWSWFPHLNPLTLEGLHLWMKREYFLLPTSNLHQSYQK